MIMKKNRTNKRNYKYSSQSLRSMTTNIACMKEVLSLLIDYSDLNKYYMKTMMSVQETSTKILENNSKMQKQLKRLEGS